MLQDAVLIGSRLDASQEASTCRLAFYGRVLKLLDPSDATALQHIKIYKLKQKRGSIDRVAPDGLSAVCKGMFKRETDISLFSGMKVWWEHHAAACVCDGSADALPVLCLLVCNLDVWWPGFCRCTTTCGLLQSSVPFRLPDVAVIISDFGRAGLVGLLHHTAGT